MEIKNMFDKQAFEEIQQRLQNLTIHHQRQWGKMTAAQMLTHCKEAYKVPLTSKPLKRNPISYIGWLFRPILYNSKPYRQSLPTAPNFIVKDERDFEKEKAEMLSITKAFHEKGAAGVGDKVHPFFGKMTAEQWGKSMWKHLDHHLRQFGA
ncbi:DUF1569 domain-containing protein [Lacibacter luteus]|uniref:DUF1569 domain-containing protein n=1 Tax=Lacibacter luteus TaxID=2508719 RepID=A0A4Q1CFQ3_9BACT|nr:DUF1569 domain-containing protein [Lacibacter luteus]RXK58477.1 DUF1569 domain-containing protein [Lacibacter luteus]